MELLSSLGINGTIWIHAVCFFVAYMALSNLVFKPYMRAHEAREARTIGSEEQAAKMLSQAAEISGEYELKAKEVSAAVRAEYERGRGAALKESEALVAAARAEATHAIEGTRTKIATEVQKAKTILAGEIPSITGAIASKMAGKEISL